VHFRYFHFKHISIPAGQLGVLGPVTSKAPQGAEVNYTLLPNTCALICTLYNACTH